MAWIDRLRMLPFRLRIGIVLLLAAIATIVTFSIPALPQPLWYHDFADTRLFFGLPNFANVISNAGFALAGAVGLWIVLRLPRDRPVTCLPYLVYSLGLMLVALGSAYYHHRPTTATLYWDRLPMTIAFMALLSALIADRIDRLAGLTLLPILLLAGIAGVTYWYYSEASGAGDLRPYLLGACLRNGVFLDGGIEP